MATPRKGQQLEGMLKRPTIVPPLSKGHYPAAGMAKLTVDLPEDVIVNLKVVSARKGASVGAILQVLAEKYLKVVDEGSDGPDTEAAKAVHRERRGRG